MFRRGFKLIKRALLAQVFFLIFFAPPPARAVTGYLFAENDFFGQEWERTLQGRWHYDAGPGIGLRVETAELAWLVYAEAAIVPANMIPSYTHDLGVGIVGQRSRIGARIGYDDLSFEAAYELRSWFVSGPEYGPQYMVDPSDVVQSLTLRVNVRVF